MSSSKQLTLPITPEKQRSVSRLSMRSSLTDELMATPEFSPRLSSLKRTFSQTSFEDAPQFASAFVDWRLECLDEQIKFLGVAQEAVIETKKEERFLLPISQELEQLESEKVILSSQKRFLVQDLEDATQAASDAYIAELEYAFASASTYGAQSLKQPRTERKPFKADVTTYLDAKNLTQCTTCCSARSWACTCPVPDPPG